MTDYHTQNWQRAEARAEKLKVRLFCGTFDESAGVVMRPRQVTSPVLLLVRGKTEGARAEAAHELLDAYERGEL